MQSNYQIFKICNHVVIIIILEVIAIGYIQGYVGLGRFWTQPTRLGEGRKDSKPTAGVNRSNWFRFQFQVRMELKSVLKFAKYWKLLSKTVNCCQNLQNFARIYKFFTRICKFSLKFAMIWLDLAKSHQIWLRSCLIWSRSRQIQLGLVGFGRTSSIILVEFGSLGFWRRKPATRPAHIDS